jgi:hypothetical protein
MEMIFGIDLSASGWRGKIQRIRLKVGKVKAREEENQVVSPPGMQPSDDADSPGGMLDSRR